MANFWMAGLVAAHLAAPGDVPPPETLVAAADAPSAAQGAPAVLPPAIRRGARRLTLGLVVPTGGLVDLGQSLGGALFVADRWALVLTALVALDRQELVVATPRLRETFTSVRLNLAPGVRYYLGANEPLAFFVEGAIVGGYSRAPELIGGRGNVSTGVVAARGLLDVALGVGGEWFIARQVSLTGEMGLRVDIVRDGHQPPWALRTLATALRANFSW